MRLSFERARLQPRRKGREGHNFSRAVILPHPWRLLAAEGLRQELE